MGRPNPVPCLGETTEERCCSQTVCASCGNTKASLFMLQLSCPRRQSQHQKCLELKADWNIQCLRQ
eukprot:1160801-Pelagomonas_calceolata.AAC.3